MIFVKGIQQFIELWSNGNREMSQLISTEAQTTRNQIIAGSGMLRDQMNTHSEANTAVINVQHRETRDHITTESSRMMEHFDSGRQADTTPREMEDLKARVLETLWFPEMNARENNIMEASEDTVR